MRPVRFPIVAVVVASLALVLGGCSKMSQSQGVVSLDSTTTTPEGGSGGPGGAAAGARPTVAASGTSIQIKNFAFSPSTLQAKVGVTITVSNADSTIHTFTADDRSIDTGNIAAGTTKTFVVNKAGDLAYHCDIHDYMKGVIHVGP